MFFPLFFFFALYFGANAQAPADYYDNAEGKTGYTLKTTLHGIIKSHSTLSYGTLWNAFEETDLKPGTNKIWDMYSDCDLIFGNNQCGNYRKECDCYNREHSFPKSWFNEASPMYTDLFHLYPTDGYVNGRRSNYPYGNVGSAKYTSSNGSKLGNCNDCSGYTGTVFEPIDEYKGDLARTYFYMVTCYEDKVSGWSSDMLNGTKNQAFSDWAKNVLIQWHRQDPVSEKEISRNNAVYQWQGNRNPFIDHPEFADKIWGDDAHSIESQEINDGKVDFSDVSVYPVAEIISVSGVRLTQVNSAEIESAMSSLPHGVYIIRYHHKDRKSTVSRKVVK